MTKSHVEKYFEMERLLGERDHTLPGTVERYGDFILISQTGIQNPEDPQRWTHLPK